MADEILEKLRYLMGKNYVLRVHKDCLEMFRKDNDIDASLVLRNYKIPLKRDIQNFICECWNLVQNNRNGCLNNLIYREYEYYQHCLSIRR